MGSPYLNSGETIVLTTNRVVAEGVSYDIMLTSERVFLIDGRMARLEPRVIPLSSILAVQGGKTPAQEPVITIIFRVKKDGETPAPFNLLFSQDPNENRKPERDEWVRGLIRLSISLQERGREPEKPAAEPVLQEPGLRPMTRHGTAPEMVRPLSNVADPDKQPAPLTVFPEVIPGSGEIPLPPPAGPVHGAVSVPDRDPDVPPSYLTPVRGTPPHPPPARVIIPQIIEELLPVKSEPVPAVTPVVPEEKLPEPEVVIDQEALFRTIPARVRFSAVTEELKSGAVEETIPEPAEPEPEPEPYVPKEIPEIIRALYTGPIETEKEEPEETAPRETGPVTEPLEPEPVPPEEIPGPAAEPQDTAPEPSEPVHRWSELFPQKTGPAEESTETVTGKTGDSEEKPQEPADDIAAPEAAALSGITTDREKEPGASHAPEYDRKPGAAAAEGAPVRHPVPPAREIRPAGTTLAYALVILIVIALVAAGAAILFLQGPSPADNTTGTVPATLSAATQPVTAVPVTTLLPATVPPSTIPPATTVAATPSPSLSAVSVPQEGVWVRLTSTAEYYGSVGNTGMMRQVSGSGDAVYQIFWPDHPVLVSVQKKDNTGAVLTATVYRNGTAISTRSVRSPMGTVEILIDPLTARAPGLSPEDSPGDSG
jgi:hypothetical protein